MNTATDLKYTALRYHQRLPRLMKQHLGWIGIPEDALHLFRIGWDGRRVTIPVTNRDRQTVFFKLLRMPARNRRPELSSSSRAHTELFGWERVLHKRKLVVICETEVERLILEGQGIAAVNSTAGPGSFQRQWAPYFDGISDVVICFKQDIAGREAALRVREIIPHSRIMNFVVPLSAWSPIAHFFVDEHRGRDEFLKSIEETPEAAITVEDIKAKVAIEDVVGRYVALRRTTAGLAGSCPFHPGRDDAFILDLRAQRFRCAGCGSEGDVVSFLMRVEKVGFPEAVAQLLVA